MTFEMYVPGLAESIQFVQPRLTHCERGMIADPSARYEMTFCSFSAPMSSHDNPSSSRIASVS